MPKRTTIEDVARLAGVTKGTVSSVLNGRTENARISAATADRVLEAVKELNYRPSALGRMLATRRSHSIGLLFQFGGHYSGQSSFTPLVMRGVCEACTEGEVDLVLFTRNPHDSDELVHALTDGRVDGVLALRDGDDPTMGQLIDQSFPSVLFFSRSDRGDVPFVDTDNFEGGRIAALHLASLGHTRMAMMKGGPGSTSSRDREAGFRQGMEEAGIPCSPGSIVEMSNLGSHVGRFRSLMASPHRPTGIFVWADDVAFGCLRILNDLGLRVPEDVSVVGFDSSDACERSIPRLTSIRQPIIAIAKEATRRLVALTNGESLPDPACLFPPELDVRSSTGPAPRLH